MSTHGNHKADAGADAAEPEAKKKRKVDEIENEDGALLLQDTANIFRSKEFRLKKVLREDARLKLITLHGSLDKDGAPTDAVVLLERKAFDASTLEKCLHQTRSCVETLKNDIYSTFDVFSGGTTADMKATLIFPATQKHIEKYTDREPFIVQETPELYESVMLPSLEESKFSFQWVYNILNKTTESERIIEEDPDPEVGFILIPDMKWDRKNVEALYLVAIIHKKGIRSIRDLRKEHLPLLENVRDKSLAAIKEKFGVTSDKLRVYFHYQPSYYHLHIHFTHVKFDAPGTDALRAHLLEDVIDNIKLNSDYYSKKTLSYVVRGGDPLFNKYKEQNYFQFNS